MAKFTFREEWLGLTQQLPTVKEKYDFFLILALYGCYGKDALEDVWMSDKMRGLLALPFVQIDAEHERMKIAADKRAEKYQEMKARKSH